MKKTVLVAALALGAMSASAQGLVMPGFGDNWSLGVEGGVATPLAHAAFFKNMKGQFGLNLKKQISPVIGLGVEGQAMINTSSWPGQTYSRTAIDRSYVGAFGTADLMNLFGGYQCSVRPFTIEAVAGAGWGHDYINSKRGKDHNFFATKAGLNFNFNVSQNVTLSLKPYVMWDMSDAHVAQTSAAYNVNEATFNVLAGVTYHFGGNGMECMAPGYTQADLDLLNGQINTLRGERDAALAAVAGVEAQNVALAAQNGDLAAQLANCQANQGKVVKEVTNQLNSVRYVFFKIGKSVITPDQMPNVEMIAAYMKSHPDSKVVIKGYASKDGPLEFNLKLAQARAEAVKNALVKKYGVKASRIQAEGQGIGEMFQEESWNRVSICTLEAAE